LRHRRFPPKGDGGSTTAANRPPFDEGSILTAPIDVGGVTCCRVDTRGRRTCVCDEGTKTCGKTCIASTSCCKDADCRSFDAVCAKGVWVAGRCRARTQKNGTACPTGGCYAAACVSCCNGSRKCTPCATASTCPGQDTECQTRICVVGVCGVAFVAAGTPTTAQTAGDCHLAQCDGRGGVMQAIDDTNVPTGDGNPCTENACLNGVPYPPQEAGTECNPFPIRVCAGHGSCVPQAFNGAPCSASVLCLSGNCVGGIRVS
jgi:hypothetical protein